ncbi:MAG: hypothetical protein JOS17DRAFT_761596 [Linnemannia elongata]|nr:MAG: hypothetical protein JOS17DRAFT_761596 [Linnemannia elongata]
MVRTDKISKCETRRVRPIAHERDDRNSGRVDLYLFVSSTSPRKARVPRCHLVNTILPGHFVLSLKKMFRREGKCIVTVRLVLFYREGFPLLSTTNTQLSLLPMKPSLLSHLPCLCRLIVVFFSITFCLSLSHFIGVCLFVVPLSSYFVVFPSTPFFFFFPLPLFRRLLLSNNNKNETRKTRCWR